MCLHLSLGSLSRYRWCFNRGSGCLSFPPCSSDSIIPTTAMLLFYVFLYFECAVNVLSSLRFSFLFILKLYRPVVQGGGLRLIMLTKRQCMFTMQRCLLGWRLEEDGHRRLNPQRMRRVRRGSEFTLRSFFKGCCFTFIFLGFLWCFKLRSSNKNNNYNNNMKNIKWK